jgi:alpha-beta hydrolase superfamily lysophospholipase
MTSTTSEISGTRGHITVRHWTAPTPTFAVVLAHGIAEHSGRYEHVGDHLAAHGAVVAAPDHWGHGRSEGEPGLVDDVEAIVSDLGLVADELEAAHPGLPLVVLGHSLGGIISVRFVQRTPGRAAALVLSGPVIGGNDLLLGLIELEEIPDIPIDPGMLSRDPAGGGGLRRRPARLPRVASPGDARRDQARRGRDRRRPEPRLAADALAPR